MTIDFPTSPQIPQLRSLWQEAFGDTDQYLDAFFSTAYSPDRCRCITADGQVAAALYWFNCFSKGNPIAYIYAVATGKGFRHQGLALKLLEDTGRHLQSLGYCGAILMPANESLFTLYEKAGYQPGTWIEDVTCKAGYVPISIESIDGEDYDDFRSIYLPAGSVIQDDVAMNFLSTQARFYKGKGFLLCATVAEGKLIAQEFLGDLSLAPRILRALHISEGRFRGPGHGHLYTMYLPLNEAGKKIPSYFGLPMD